MTKIYFIRHAQSDYSIHDDRTRPLSEEGLRNSILVADYLRDKHINVIFSSPYKRAIDTIAGFAKSADLPINIVDDFRERKVDGGWIEDFFSFSQRQWADFSYKLSDGECLAEVQERNVAALSSVLTEHKGKNIVIGTHGTALSTIINYYDNTYGFDDFMDMAEIMPWVVRMDFNDDGCVGMEKIDLFKPAR